MGQGMMVLMLIVLGFAVYIAIFMVYALCQG